MPALQAGNPAPPIVLPDLHGRAVSLHDLLPRGPVVLAFFKVSCPVCQYALPFVERIHQAYRGKASVVGVSQNPKNDTAQFLREYGITFPTLLDDARTYTASNAYGLTNVPTVFLIGTDGVIEVSSVGWSRADIEGINRWLAEATSGAVPSLFHRGEDVADSKAG